MTERITMPAVLDGHFDTLLTGLYLDNGKTGRRDFFSRSKMGHIDLPRAREGQLAGGFFAVCVPDPPTEKGTSMPDTTGGEDGDGVKLPPPLTMDYARQVTFAITNILFRLETNSQGQLKIVRTASELADCLERGILAAILHYEGAEAIDPDLEILPILYRAGLRSLGIVWSRPNQFGHGVPFKFPGSPDIGPGLTPAGKQLVRTCNELGIMIDLSHLNERGFWDVANLSQAPLVATHSAAHAICPHPRNLTDRQLQAIGESRGVVGINFHVGFVRPDGKIDPETSLDVIVDHIDHVANLIGIDHVALGSDLDGAIIPAAVGDVTGLPRVFAALEQRGYDAAALQKLASQNWMRLLKATWKPWQSPNRHVRN